VVFCKEIKDFFFTLGVYRKLCACGHFNLLPLFPTRGCRLTVQIICALRINASVF
jgi:hypothetical protein